MKVPVNGLNINIGIWPVKPISPSMATESVILYTSQEIAIYCIHEPVSEVIYTEKNKR